MPSGHNHPCVWVLTDPTHLFFGPDPTFDTDTSRRALTDPTYQPLLERTQLNRDEQQGGPQDAVDAGGQREGVPVVLVRPVAALQVRFF